MDLQFAVVGLHVDDGTGGTESQKKHRGPAYPPPATRRSAILRGACRLHCTGIQREFGNRIWPAVKRDQPHPVALQIPTESVGQIASRVEAIRRALCQTL